MSLEGEIERMYNDGVSIKDMLRVLPCGYHKMYRIITELKEEGRIVPRSKGQRKQKLYDNSNPCFYSWNHHTQHFYIRRAGIYYGIVKTEKQAKRFVELMEDCDGDYRKRWIVKEMVLND